MAETSTLRMYSNPRLEECVISFSEEQSQFENISHINWRNSTPHGLLGSYGSQTVLYPRMPSNVFLSHQGSDAPLFSELKDSTSKSCVGIFWHQASNARSSFELSLVEGSDHSLVWHRNYDRTLDSSISEALALQWVGAYPVLARIMTDVDSMTTKEWTALVDEARGWKSVSSESVDEDKRDQGRLMAKLQASFEIDAVEDGMGHPAEEIIDRALRNANGQQVLVWLRNFCTDATRPSFAASVLRCLARYDHAGTSSWRVGLVREGLAIDNVEIRDAAVQAAESWGDSDLLEVLISHREPEQWLRHYIVDVIGDLGG